jgi:hypothetical protein
MCSLYLAENRAIELSVDEEEVAIVYETDYGTGDYNACLYSDYIDEDDLIVSSFEDGLRI